MDCFSVDILASTHKKRRQPHTACPSGKRVRVKLKSTGEVFIDKFKERRGGTVWFWSGRVVSTRDIEQFTIVRRGKDGLL